MDIKYQIFISSTYTDLTEARTKVRDAILSMHHFPVGMELFSASDEEQWQIIRETIDSSDYYVLIIGHRYGTVIEDEGISYTEKEFMYARDSGIPILAFLMDDNVSVFPEHIEKDHPDKLVAFNNLVKTGRMVEWWKTTDELAQKVTVALYKQITRTKRPGWIRGDSIDVEKSFSIIIGLNEQIRKLTEENKSLVIENQKLKEKPVKMPKLSVTIQVDLREKEKSNKDDLDDEERRKLKDSVAVDSEGNIHLKVGVVNTGIIEAQYCTVDKEDFIDELRGYVTDKEIKEYNEGLPSKGVLEKYLKEYCYYHMVKNHGIDTFFLICNDGKTKATDVSVTVEFPKEILVFDIDDVNRMKEPKAPEKPRDLQEIAYERARKSEVVLKNLYSQLESMNGYSSSIWPTLTPMASRVDFDESIDISDNVVEIESKGIVHTKFGCFSGIRIVPMVKGTFKAKAILMCAEYEKPDETEITFVCE